MKTVFKVGMKVYDRLVFPDKEAEVIDIIEDSQFPIRVWYEGLEADELIYTTDGRYYQELEPSLATKPYTIEGFEQKAPIPTYDEIRAESLKKGEYVTLLNGIELPDEKMAKAFETLAKLIWLRDYYNEGWQADWDDSKQTKYTIEVCQSEFWCDSYTTIKKILSFKNDKNRDKFLEEQKELLEIAKPLL